MTMNLGALLSRAGTAGRGAYEKASGAAKGLGGDMAAAYGAGRGGPALAGAGLAGGVAGGLGVDALMSESPEAQSMPQAEPRRVNLNGPDMTAMLMQQLNLPVAKAERIQKEAIRLASAGMDESDALNVAVQMHMRNMKQ